MNNKELAERYPWLWLREDFRSDSEEILTWADMIPTGWYTAFGELLFEDLDRALKESYPEGIPEDFVILDVKEKWGRLVIYLSEETRLVRDVLLTYEYLSSFVCISCGVPYPFSHMTYEGWVMPLCEKCFSKKCRKDLDNNNRYLQTILKDSISVFKGPEKYLELNVLKGDGTEEKQQINIHPTWKRIVEKYVNQTLV